MQNEVATHIVRRRLILHSTFCILHSASFKGFGEGW